MSYVLDSLLNELIITVKIFNTQFVKTVVARETLTDSAKSRRKAPVGEDPYTICMHSQ